MKDRHEVRADLEKREGTTEIQAEIAKTRVEMGGTIDAIHQKLNPETLAEQAKERAQDVVEHAKDAVREATIGRAERAMSDAGQTATGVRMSVTDTIKHNPLPAALAALSIGWLWKKRSRSASSGQPYAYRGEMPAYFGPGGPTYGYGYGQGYGAGQGYGSGQGYGTGQDYRPEQGSSGIGQVTEQVGEKVGQVKAAAGQTASNLASTAGQAAGTAGETAADFGSELMETIKSNPLPAALTGIGLGWLWMNRPAHEARPYAYSGTHTWQGNRYQNGGYGQDSGRSVAGQAQHAVGHVAGQVQGTVSQVAGQVQDTASQAAERVTETAGQVAGQVQDAASQAAERVGDTAGQMVDTAQYQARRARGQFQSMMEDNPLMVGTLAAAAGLAVGLATPSTERENRMMGEARERVVERVQDTAQEAMQKVQQVASEAADAAKSAADDATKSTAGEQKLTV
jgi:gas vesicle protein